MYNSVCRYAYGLCDDKTSLSTREVLSLGSCERYYSLYNNSTIQRLLNKSRLFNKLEEASENENIQFLFLIYFALLINLEILQANPNWFMWQNHMLYLGAATQYLLEVIRSNFNYTTITVNNYKWSSEIITQYSRYSIPYAKYSRLLPIHLNR